MRNVYRHTGMVYIGEKQQKKSLKSNVLLSFPFKMRYTNTFLSSMRKNNLKNTLIFFNIFCKYRYTFFSCLCSYSCTFAIYTFSSLCYFVCYLNRHIRAIFTVIALSNLSYGTCLLISCVIVRRHMIDQSGD